MENNTNAPENKESIHHAIASVNKNDHQDLAKENLGIEAEEQPPGNPENPKRMKGFDDKRPEDSTIQKGWTVDSNTSRGPQDLSTTESEGEIKP
jgi:hypothetical protein